LKLGPGHFTSGQNHENMTQFW